MNYAGILGIKGGFTKYCLADQYLKDVMDNTTYFKSIEDNLRKYGTPTHFDGGYFNGYVVVLPEHPFYGKDYDEVSYLLSKKGFYVHGGLTFANDDKDFCPELSKHFSDYWILGFDTRHANDTADYWTEERTWEETEKLLQAIIHYGE
nr:MAG TPA: hypothetical protein [Caudoviricetes sp.]